MDKRDSFVLVGILVETAIPVLLVFRVANRIIDTQFQ